MINPGTSKKKKKTQENSKKKIIKLKCYTRKYSLIQKKTVIKD